MCACQRFWGPGEFTPTALSSQLPHSGEGGAAITREHTQRVAGEESLPGPGLPHQKGGLNN